VRKLQAAGVLVFLLSLPVMAADVEPPWVSASVATGELWPPNQKMVNVGLSAIATDDSGNVFVITGVYSDEDHGNSIDASDPGPGTLQLRAEREGKGDGRVYLILIRAFDDSFNTSHDCVSVVVPKSRNPALVAGLEAQAAAAVAECKAFGGPPAGYFPLTESIE
jgi:hypothetical protein